MNNYKPKFKKGDIVCIKPVITSAFFGESKTRLIDIRPYKVIRVYKDEEAHNRYGEPGDSHKYLLEDAMNEEFNMTRLQYELMYWEDIKDQVIAKYQKIIDDFKNFTKD
jgi:hypothetical protein